MDDSDEALTLRVGKGDRNACRQLVRRHVGRIVGFAGRVLGDRHEAEDVAQEVFERLWIHAARWRPGRALLGTWLHTIALNLCRDRLAKRRGHPLDEIPEPADTRPSPATRMQQQDIGTAVNREILSLPEQQRIAITLCHYEDMRNIEAAEVMGISIEALESLLARGRKRLRSQLQSIAPGLRGEDWEKTE